MSEKIEFPATPLEQVFSPKELRDIIDFSYSASVKVEKFNAFDGNRYVTSLINREKRIEIKSELPLPFALDSSGNKEEEVINLRNGLRSVISRVEANLSDNQR